MNRAKKEGITPDYIMVLQSPQSLMRAGGFEKIDAAARERVVAAFAAALGEHQLRREAIQRATATIMAARVSNILAREAGHFLP